MDQKRKRSVVLTPAALGLIRAQVEKEWQERGQGKKLTREVQAELLGVSVATATRMMAGNGIDRSSAQIAFRNVNLEWTREHVEGTENTSNEVKNEQPIQPVALKAVLASNSPRNSVRTRYGIAYIGLVLLGLGILFALFGWSSKSLPASPERTQAADYERLLGARAFTLFASANYNGAITEAGYAVMKARELGLQVDLAANLRILADIYDATGRSAEAIRTYQESQKIFLSLGDASRLPPISEALGMAQLRDHQYAMASQNLWMAYTGWHSQHDSTGQAMATRDLGTLAFELHKAKEAIRWFDEAESFLPKVGQDEMKMDIRAQRALATAQLGPSQQAIVQLKLCEQYWTIKNHRRWIATTHLQLGLATLQASQFTEAEHFLIQSSEEFALCGDQIGLKKVNEAEKLLHSRSVS